MPTQTFKSRLVQGSLAAVALGAWVCTAGSSISDAYGWSLALKPWSQALCNALFFAAALLFARSRSREEPSGEAETLLGGLVVGGLLVLSAVLVGLLTPYLPQEGINYFMTEAWPPLITLPVIAYLTWSFVALRGLIDERTDATRSGWNIFYLLLLVAATSAFGPWPNIARYAFAGIAGVLAFTLVLRVKWIAELRSTPRRFAFFYLLLLAWVFGVLGLKFLQDPTRDIFHRDPLANLFPLLLLGFNAAYVNMSLLAVLFNWPISSVIERRARDLEGFEKLFERSAGGDLSEQDLQHHLFELAMKRSGADAGFRSRPFQHRGRVMHMREGGINMEEIARWESAFQTNGFSETLNHRDVVYVPDTRRHKGLLEMADRFRTALAFRLEVNGDDEGFLVLLHQHQDAFDRQTIRTLHNFVKQSLLAEEKNRLVDQAVENERMKNEFEIATRVQENLLPQSLPQRSWVEMAVSYRPALLVGGDFYDFFDIGDEAIHAVLGDVTGKGLGAAFNVAELKGIFHSHLEFLDDPVTMLARVNQAVSACFAPDVFFTMIYLGIQPNEGEYTLARAGHCLPLHFHAETGEAEYIEEGFLGLGIERRESYRDYIKISRHAFRTNDVLVLYTDGIVEATAPDGEELYDEARLLDVVTKSAYFDVEMIKNNILSDVQRFQEGGPVSDDITLLVVKFL